MDLSTLIGILNSVFALCGVAGGVFAFRNARRDRILSLQKETIGTLQEQINAIKAKIETLEAENNRLNLVIETIQSALLERGLIITIKGELVTISDAQSGTVSTSRKQIQRRRAPDKSKEQQG